MHARTLLASCCLAASLFAQSGWNQLTPPQSPPALERAAAAYDSARGRIVLFGGHDGVAPRSETWEWDGTDWRRIVTANAPPPRAGHALAFDSLRGVVVLFGGLGVTHFGDTWQYDGKDWQRALPAPSPPARTDHALVFDGRRARMLLFGGWSGTALLADHWEWDGTSWTERQLTARPPARAGHAAGNLVQTGDTILHGGFGGGYLADTWHFDGSDWKPAGSGPDARAHAAISADPQRRALFLFGGIGGAPALRDDLWVWERGRWAAEPEPNRPPPRYGHVFVWHGRTGEHLLFGGRGASGPLGDTWLLRKPLIANASFDEAFVTDAMRDPDASSAGTWGGGSARPGRLGNDGLHGDFVPAGSLVTLNTDDQTFPGSVTLSGMTERVTNGEFRFGTLHVPDGTTLRITGSNPARIFVRGRAIIEGRIDASAPAQPLHPYTNPVGQPGGLPGPGGAPGGKGADPGNGLGNQSRFNGANGADVLLEPAHPYRSSAAGTGGTGSAQYPASGLNSAVTYNGYFQQFSAQLAAGGGGGGFRTAGAPGRALWNNTNPPIDLGPDAPGGGAFDLLDDTRFPLPPTNPGMRNLSFFLAGGAGGGGGGSHPHFSARGTVPIWRPGAGGAGGGGAIALRLGDELLVGATGTIQARGGDGAKGAAPHPTPGGGGSGGSILVQTGGVNPRQLGLLTVRGGLGGEARDTGSVYQLHTVGGSGGAGLARLELPLTGPPVTLIGNVEPPAGAGSVATLSDFDAVTGVRSKWFVTRTNTVPAFLRYELRAIVDSRLVVFSDDPAVGRLAGIGQPVRFYVQGARLDPVTGEPVTGSLTPWLTTVGPFRAGSLDERGANAVRFTILFDRALAATISITRATVLFHEGTGSVIGYGQGCGPTGFVPRLTAPAGRTPRVGAPLPLIAEQLSPGRPAVLHLGISRNSWNGIPLPFDLAPLGAPGCFVLASGEWALPLLNATGRVLFELPVPPDPRLHGARFFGQIIVREPAANPLGVAVSNGIEVVLE